MVRIQLRPAPRVFRLGVCIATACLAASLIGDATTCFAGCGGYVLLYRGPHMQAARAAAAGQASISASPGHVESPWAPTSPCLNGECRERTPPPRLPPDSPPTRSRPHGDCVSPAFAALFPQFCVAPLAATQESSSDEIFLGGIFRPPRNGSGRTS